MDGLKMAQHHASQPNSVDFKGVLFGALSAAAAGATANGFSMDPRSLAMAAAFLQPVNLAGFQHQQQAAAAAAFHHGFHHHFQQVGRSLPAGPSSSGSPTPPLPIASSAPREVKMMETWVLIPPELSLLLEPEMMDKHEQPQVRVWTRVSVAQGRRWSPFQGTVRLGALPASSADINEMRYHSSGCYEEVTEVAGHPPRKVRHCNWVRFLRPSPLFTPHVNVVCSKLKGEPVYEAVRPISAGTELVVFYLPGLSDDEEEMLYGGLPAVRSLRSSLFRRTMGLILQDSPLDLSLSLLTSNKIGADGSSTVPITPPSPLPSAPQLPVSTSQGASDGRLSVSSDGLSTTGGLSSGREDENASTSGLDASSETLLLAHHHHHSALNLPSSAVSGLKTSGRHSSSAGRPARQRPLLPCQVCGKAFDRPSLLNRHMRTHTGEKPHVCDVCGKGFSTSSSLNTHRRIHSGEKPHQCPVCGKRFTASSNLYYHRMTHIKEKPHKCALCSKSFPTPGDLKSHMYVHSGSWPFKCHVCSRGFSKHTNLKNHLFLHTGDKPHACELCNKRFALACNLRAHMKTHEGEPQEECARCGKTFLMPPTSNGEVLMSGLCGDCSGDVEDVGEEDAESASADGDVDVDINDQD